jgi:hypothetical protein
MMGSTALTTDLVTDLTTIRRQLLAGKLTGARHELQILSDEGANDDTFIVAKSVVSFFEGDKDGAAKLLRRVQGIERSHSSELEQLYGQLLVEGSICKALMRDTHADLVEEALKTAKHLLMKDSQDERAAVTTYIDILDHVATSRTAQALSLYRKMATTWGDSTDPVVQSWKQVFDMAIFRLLCEHTRLADRLFTATRGRPEKRRELRRYEAEIMCINVFDDILRSDAPKRNKLVAVRIFIFGRVGVWS